MRRIAALRAWMAGAALMCALPAAAEPVQMAVAGPIVNFPGFGTVCGGALVCSGDAAEVGNVLRLVPAAREQSGAAWLANAFDLSGNAGFTSTFSFRLGGGGMIADGLAFIMARDPTSLGDASRYGGSMGFEEVGGIFAVEFDTFDNGEPGRDNHVGLDRDGNLKSLAWDNPYGVTGCEGRGVGCMANGDVWTAVVAYDGAAQTLSVSVQDGSKPKDVVIAGYSVNLREVVGGDRVWLGFSAGTGDGFMNHDLMSWVLSSGPAAVAANTIAEVPEPGSAMVLAPALLGLLRRRRGARRSR